MAELIATSWPEASAAWQTLWSQQSEPCVFNHAAWIHAVQQAYSGRIQVLFWAPHGTPQGACVLQRCGWRTWQHPGGRKADHHVMLLQDPEQAPDWMAALAAHRPWWQRWHWSHWCYDTPAGHASLARGPEQQLSIGQERVCPRWAWVSHRPLLPQLSKKKRDNIKRLMRRATQLAPLELRLERPDTAFFERLFAMHRARWAQSGKRSKFLKAKHRCFLATLAQHLPSDLVHASTLWWGTTPVSCHFGFQTPHWVQWSTPAYDPAYHRISPGFLHLWHAAQQAHAAGLEGLDFLQGDEPYKWFWANGCVRTCALTLETS